MVSGFKDSTKTQYTSGGKCFAKGGVVKGPKGAAGDSKGFAAHKKGPVVKKASGGVVKKSLGGVLKAALPLVSPLAGAIVNKDPLAMLPGAFLAKKLINSGGAHAPGPTLPVDETPVTTAAKGGLIKIGALKSIAPLKGVPAFKGKPLVAPKSRGFAAKR